MNPIDPDLLAALTGLEPDQLTPDLMEQDPELRARYEGALALRDSLETEGAQRRAFVEEALARPARGEDRVRELVLAQGSVSPRRGAPAWALTLALAAAVALLWLRPWAAGPIVEPEPGPVPIQVLDGGGDGLRVLSGPVSAGAYGELGWTPLEGGAVTYDVSIWAADETGAVLDPAQALVRERHLTDTRWTIPDESALPDSIVVEVRALDGGSLVESSPRAWLRRSVD